MRLRLAHISDIHVTTRCRWRLGDFFSKRLTSWMNLRFRGRAAAFPHTRQLLVALQTDLRARHPDVIVFSGDATALGFREEIEAAADLLGVRDPTMPPGFAVPGNHDHLTRSAARSGHFEAAFAPWLVGERLDEQHTYPFARRIGGYWLVGVNSSVGNVLPQDARGQVGQAQLTRLAQLLSRLDGAPRILVTHYPVCQRDGLPDRRYHELRDLAGLVQVAEEGKIALWLHGHRHDPYHLTPPGLSFPVICAGSTTMRGVEMYHEYAIEEGHLRATARRFDPAGGGFVDADGFEMALRQ
jgi:3',5'-cyclic AMP phosphodiesterase CpdA